MKTKCLSVRLQSLVSISDRAYKATAFDGSTAILPKSQVFGIDYDVQKSDAYWIAAWILEQKDLQYSDKKVGWYDPYKDRVNPNVHIEVIHHKPTKIEPVTPEANAHLTR